MLSYVSVRLVVEKCYFGKIAINYRSATICDNEGNKYDGIKIDENGDDGIFVNLEVEKLAEISGCEVSLSAGSFVCNDLIYMIRNYYQDKVQAGFIHVPYLPEQTRRFGQSVTGRNCFETDFDNREFIEVDYEI